MSTLTLTYPIPVSRKCNQASFGGGTCCRKGCRVTPLSPFDLVKFAVMDETIIEYRYLYCCKKYKKFGGEGDGCQEFLQNPAEPLTCLVCGCHQGFHYKILNYLKYEKQVVYTKCLRKHDPSVDDSFDGCQEFADGLEGSPLCESCGCHKNFRRHEINVPPVQESS